jgi:hypothetical protein
MEDMHQFFLCMNKPGTAVSWLELLTLLFLLVFFLIFFFLEIGKS